MDKCVPSHSEPHVGVCTHSVCVCPSIPFFLGCVSFGIKHTDCTGQKDMGMHSHLLHVSCALCDSVCVCVCVCVCVQYCRYECVFICDWTSEIAHDGVIYMDDFFSLLTYFFLIMFFNCVLQGISVTLYFESLLSVFFFLQIKSSYC